jgi:hypothetical protein
MPLGNVTAAVPNPFLRYAQEAGWSFWAESSVLGQIEVYGQSQSRGHAATGGGFAVLVGGRNRRYNHRSFQKPVRRALGGSTGVAVISGIQRAARRR